VLDLVEHPARDRELSRSVGEVVAVLASFFTLSDHARYLPKERWRNLAARLPEEREAQRDERVASVPLSTVSRATITSEFASEGTPDGSGSCGSTFVHEALFYEDEAAFVAATAPMLRTAIAGDEPALVLLNEAKVAALRDELGADARRVQFVDMTEAGRNPARIIPLWQRFVDENACAGRRLRGIGEAIWATRSAPELVECQRHEVLLNLAFAGSDFLLLCPYNTGALAESVIEEARHSHRYLAVNGVEAPSTSYTGSARATARHTDPLSSPPPGANVFAFDATSIEAARHWAARQVCESPLGKQRSAEFVVAVNEVVTNSATHGGGWGMLRLWSEDGWVIAEASDHGMIDEVMAGRLAPALDSDRGRGLWIANQLCDLVQIRSLGDGTVVRLLSRP
jgi:anti-sigma regulatory factor (Ser/Thr protein kinase)